VDVKELCNKTVLKGCISTDEALLLLFLTHQHKAAGMEIKLSKNNDHDGVSHGIECSQEGDGIPPLKSNRQVILYNI